MSDGQPGLSFQQGAGQPPKTDGTPAVQPAAPVQGSGEQPKYVTVEEARRMADEAAEAAFRRAQGLTDKAAQRIQDQVTQKMAAWEKAYQAANPGQQLTQEQKQAVQQALAAEVSSGEQQPTQPAAAQTGQGAGKLDDFEARYIERRTQEIFAAAGATVEQEDEEAKEVDFSSPEAFLRTVQAAAEKKAARVGAASQGGLAPGGVRSPALGAGNGRVNSIANINDPATLLKMALNGR